MKRKNIKEILQKHGYKDNTIDKIFQLKVRPKLTKAIEIEKEDGIPCTAWENIKSYIENSTNNNQSTTSTNINSEVA